MAGFRFSNSAVQYIPSAGQEEWTAASGTFSWVVPNGVYSICAVCIGGGGGGAASTAVTGVSGGGGGSLTWGNNIPVTPGETLTIIVGAGGARATVAGAGGDGGESYIARGATRLIAASAGQGGQLGQGVATTQINGTYTTQSGATYGGGAGGSGTTLGTAPAATRPTGGGGAGGYSGAGGAGGNQVSTAGSNGAGGGGGGGAGGTTGSIAGAGGGGVLPYGEGSSGVGGAGTGNFSGTGGSSGKPTTSLTGYNNKALAGTWSPPEYSLWGQHGGEFGGGGGAAAPSATPGFTSGYGCRGCVRILWGVGRAFPSTNVADYDASTVSPASQSNYTTPGTQTFTVPANVRYVGAVCIGGGGGGGQGLAQTNSCSSGGGGALVWGNFKVTPGESFTVVIGAAGQSTGTNTQTAGGASYITRNVSFKGFISGTSLFITEVLSGIITTGISITGAGVTTATINSFVTGEYGKEGTYIVSVSQTVGTLASTITFSGTIEVMRAGGGNVGGTAAAPTGASAGGTFSVSSAILPTGTYGGGNGGNSTSGSTASTISGAQGGAAGGYAGNGASALRTTASTGTGAGSYAPTIGSGAPTTGQSSAVARSFGAGGGGVGIFGQGTDGGASARTGANAPTLSLGGLGGSGGSDGSTHASTGNGGNYGAGGGGQGNAFVSGSGNGAGGAVRFVWGKGRVYPNHVPDV